MHQIAEFIAVLACALFTVAFRKMWAEKCGIDFELPSGSLMSSYFAALRDVW